jgi:hypothetical protein
MLSFRNSMRFITAAGLAAAIWILAHPHRISIVSVHSFAACGSPTGVAVKPPPPDWVPRSSSRASELAGSNHEGF